MTQKPIIHLCIPQLFQPLKLWSRDFHFEPKAPELSQLLRQFDCEKTESTQGLDASLFNAIGMAKTEELPVAHYRYQIHNNSQPIAEKTLLCADPVHLEVGMNDITLTEIITDLSEAEAQEMLDELNAHFEQDGLEFILGSNQHWYLFLPESETLKTTPLSVILRKNIASFQPRSTTETPAVNWQVIQNEAQMILHASTVNQQREMAGLTTVNSLCFWGGGKVDKTKEANESVSDIFCNASAKSSAQMIAKAAHCDWAILSDDLSERSKFKAGKSLIILDTLFYPTVHDHLDNYQQALIELDEKIIKPLREAWRSGEIDLLIDGCDDNVLRPLKVPAWKFWKHTMKIIRRKPIGNISQAQNQASLLARVFAMRGINDQAELVFELKNLHPISKLKGIQTATDLVIEAIKTKQRLLIIGDFDADGATSTALAVRALRLMGHDMVDYLVPNRFEFGYGLTPEIVVEAQKFSPDMIITVDNGISSIKGVEQAKAQGCKVIITDHHLPAKNLPDADAIINPNQHGDKFPSKNLAGVGVIFYLMLSVKSSLHKQNYFADNNLAEPNLTELLDLVALGTVADVVPLDQNNRILVEQGLRRMRGGMACEGINALFRIGKRNIRNAVSSDLGFACGPRLNAAGRMDDMSLGIECLLSNDTQQAMDLASALDDLNIERRATEDSMKAEAMILLEELDDDKLSGDLPPVICLYKASWHQGVIGILAARVRERYNRPTIIFAPADASTPLSTSALAEGDAISEISEIKGSARSISTIHIRDIFDEVATLHPHLLNKFGGHAMAAGLSLEASKLDEFTQAICDVVQSHANEDTFQEIHYSDGELQPDDFALKSADDLRYAAPWGQHFPAPVFDNRFTIVNKRLLKDKHYKLVLRPVVSAKTPAQTVDAIAFNIDIKSWPEEGDEVHLLYRLEVNEFRDACTLQLMVERLLA